uniref:Uncharacterized protein n=1 Tax=Talaromyces marneffei PM1 TaxID=1077442 RepID=A0A093UQL8_TALMA
MKCLDDISYKGTGRTTCTANEHSNETGEMGEIQGAQICETMESASIYHHVENKVISADNSLVIKKIQDSFQKVVRILGIQRNTMTIQLKRLEAQIHQMNGSYNAKIKEMEQLHKNQVLLYKTHGITAIEEVVDEVDRLRARVAQIESAPEIERYIDFLSLAEVTDLRGQVSLINPDNGRQPLLYTTGNPYRISVVQVNKDLYQRLRGNQPSRFILKTVAPSSREAHAAFAGEVTCWEAVKRYYNRTQAFKRASPYSVAVLPGTSKFIYENGILLYGLNDEIRIRNIYRDVTGEKVIDINALRKEITPSVEWNKGGLILLYYHSDILAFRVKIAGGWRLLVLDLYRKRVKLITDLPEVRGLVVRHNSLHLFVVFFSEQYDQHWVIRKFDLPQEIEIGEPTILEEFGDFGDTSQGVCFEIFSDKLHGVSSHVTVMELASDRSFYKWICIAPDSKSRRMTAKKIFRRYHELYEGVLKYAKLSLQVDESTGRPMILECRDERRNWEEISCRTYYVTSLSTRSIQVNLVKGLLSLLQIPLTAFTIYPPGRS